MSTKVYCIMFVCLGNICRSPMAEFVMKDILEKKGMSDRFYIASAATSYEEVGNPVHVGTRNRLAKEGISVDGKYAVRLTAEDYDKYDMIVVMDSSNYRDVMDIVDDDPENKVFKLLYFTGSNRDVADPWYTGDFDTTYNDVFAGCNAIIAKLNEEGII